MKKTFRTILAGAVALLSVSCYDDLALREDIANLGDDLKGLEERITALENTLNAEVGGINDLASRLADAEDAVEGLGTDLEELQGIVSGQGDELEDLLGKVKLLDEFDGKVDGLIDDVEAAIAGLIEADKTFASKSDLAAAVAKIAVVNVEEKDGNIVLTLADGKTVSLSKPLENVENTGLVTVVEIDGVKYWAVKDASGVATSLDVPVGHPDMKIEFEVTAEGKLVYTVNGGEQVETGVSISDIAGSDFMITDIKENNDNVVITIGDLSFTLPKYSVGAQLELSRSEFYVGYGLSKTVTVSGVEDYYVASKPDGWKVTAEGNTITVTAPSKQVAELGVAELEGEIVIHADAEKCTYASMNVSCGEAFSIEVDSSTGVVTIFNSLAVEYPDYTGMYEPTYDFGDALVGVMPLSDFEYFASVDELIEASENYVIPSGYLASIKNNLEIWNEYIPGEVEEETIKLTIAELGASFYPPCEIAEGEHYVVWAVPQTDKVMKELYTFDYYKPITIALEEKTKLYNDITLTLTCSGGVSYYANCFPAEMFEYMTLKDFMEVGYGVGEGPWKSFQNTGMAEAMGTPVSNGMDISLKELMYEDLKPNTKHIVYVFPIQDGKAPADYVYETDFEPYVYEFTTAPLVAGGTPATLDLDAATDYTSVSVKVTPPAGTTTYYYYYNPGAADEYTDDQLAADVMSRCFYPFTEEKVVKASNVPAGTSKELVVVSVTEDGKFAIARDVFSSLEYPYSEAILVTFDSLTKDEETGEYTAVFNVSGATKFAAYNTSNANVGVFPANVLKNGLTNGYSSYKWVDVIDGKATVVFKPSSTYYDYLTYSAYNVSADAVTDLSEPATIKLSEKL